MIESFRDGDSNVFLHDIRLCNSDTGKVFYKDLGFIYLELINFTKKESDSQNDLEGWLLVLKNMSSMDKLPSYLRKPVFEKLFQIAEYGKFSKEEKEMYDVSLKRKWDNKAVLDYAKEEGRNEERTKAAVEKRAIALQFKKMGIPVADIAKGTGLTVEEIEKLK